MPRQQRSKDHDAPFFIQQFWLRLLRTFEDPLAQPFKRENVKPRIPAERGRFEQLPLDLISSLLRREENQRQTIAGVFKRLPGLVDTPKRLPSSGGSQQKFYAHGDILR